MRQTPDKMKAWLTLLRKKMNLKSLVITLAAIVVFTTTYLLILPAFTLDKEEAVQQGGIDVVAEETAAMETESENVETSDSKESKESEAVTTDAKEKEEKSDEQKKDPESDKESKTDGQKSSQSTGGSLQAEGDGFTVSATPAGKSDVPDTAELQVEELKSTDKELKDYRKEALEALKKDSDDVKGIKEIKVYDMSLESDGKAVDTNAKFNVKIEYEDGVTVEDADNVRVLTFDDQKKAEVLDTKENKVETKVEETGKKSNVTEASFETEGISKVAVVEVETIEKTVITADGKTYKVTVKYGKDAQIPDGATLDVKELKGNEYDAYLEKTANKLDKSADDLGMAKFFDITIKNGDEEVKIANPVDVEIKLLDSELANDTQVLHFANENKADLVDSTVSGDTVKFEAEGFSVYAIVNEDGVPQPPRVTFEFEDPNNPDFYFVDKAGNHQNTQIVKDGEVLQDVGLPTIPENETFGGWFIYNGNTTVEAVNFESPISVAYGDTSSLSASSITINPDELNEDGTYHVKVKAYFGEVVYLTFYEDAAGNNILNKIQIAKGSNYDIATQTLNAPNSELAFGGWSATSGQNDDNRTAITPTALTNITADRSFYPIFKSGHWLTFHSGATGSGATYRAPAFVMAGATASSAQPANPTWKGYAFQYWTETNLYTGENGAYVQPSSAPARFNFNTTVNESKTLYAYWTPADTTYTVVFWRQNVTDAKNATNKTYSFAGQETKGATSGTTVTAESYEKYRNSDGTIDFSIGYDLNSNKSDTSIVVKPDGTSIINVYFDRQLITMRFYKTAGTVSYNYQGRVTGYTAPVSYNSNNWNNNSYADSYTGLYGQTWEQAGYSTGWPTPSSGNWWYYNSNYSNGSNSTGQGYMPFTGMTFLGQFVLPEGVYNTDRTEIRLFRLDLSTSDLEFYLQNVDGITYPTTPSDTGTASQGGSFVFSEKYDGYTVSQYRRYRDVYGVWYYGYFYEGNYQGATYQRVYYDSNGNAVQNGDNAWASAAVNATVALSGQNRYYNLQVRYARKHFTLKYLDSVDSTELRGISTKDVVYGASLSGLKPATSFVPTSQYPGKVWDGKWYKDQACTQEFDWNITMPNDNMVVYAGWEDVQYKVDIDPNGGVLTSGESTFTWLTYGRTIEHYQDVVRDYVEDPNGSYKYESFLRSVYLDAGYDPWDYRGTVRTAKYVSNDTSTSVDLTPYTPDSSHQAGTVTYPYDSTRYKYEKGAYALIGWYELTFADGHYGDLDYVTSEKLYSFDTEIDHDTYIQAKWRRVGEYHVDYMTDVYLMDEDGNVTASDSGIDTTNVPADNNSYADFSQSAIMRSPDTPITVGTGEDAKQYVFEGWYYDGHIHTPGDIFTVKASLAVDKVIGHDEATGEDIIQKTVNIYPVYRAVDDMPVDTTHIFWYSNWKDTDGNVIEGRTEANQLKDETNDKLQPNKAIDIMDINDLLGTNTDYDGYSFKGWARVPENVDVSAETFNANDYMYLYWDGADFHVDSENGTVVTKVAADENPPYHDMYAVWEIKKYTVTITKSVESSVAADQHVGFTFAPEFTKYSKTKYSNFILAGERTEGTSEEGQSYVYETSKTFTEVPYGATLKLTETTGSEFTASAEYTFTTDKDGTAIPVAEQETKEYKNGVDTLTISGDVTVAYTNTKNTQKIKIYKVDVDTEQPLGNAQFTLKGQTITSSNEEATKGFTEEVELDVSATPYTLTETEAPAGYNLPENSYTVKVSSDGVTCRNMSGAQKVELKEGVYVITITNTSGTPLPHTGGIGTTIFYIFGSLLVIGCGIVLVSRKRMGSNK